MTLEWKDPPSANRSPTVLSDELRNMADELRSHPGQWALIRRCPTAEATYSAVAYYRGTCKAFRPTESFEIIGREMAIYARYIGRPKDNA